MARKGFRGTDLLEEVFLPEIAKRAEEQKQKKAAQAIAARQNELKMARLKRQRRKGRRKAILTSGLGLTEEARTTRPRASALLGG